MIARTHKEEIMSNYMDYVAERSERPGSMEQFGSHFKIDMKKLFQQFESTEEIEVAIFNQVFKKTVADLNNSELAEDYSLKEKLLSIFYNWVNHLSRNREFIIALSAKEGDIDEILVHVKDQYDGLCEVILGNAIDNSELSYEYNILVKYKNVLWQKFRDITKMWLENDAFADDKTDDHIVRKVDHLVNVLATKQSNPGIVFGSGMF